MDRTRYDACGWNEDQFNHLTPVQLQQMCAGYMVLDPHRELSRPLQQALYHSLTFGPFACPFRSRQMATFYGVIYFAYMTFRKLTAPALVGRRPDHGAEQGQVGFADVHAVDDYEGGPAMAKAVFVDYCNMYTNLDPVNWDYFDITSLPIESGRALFKLLHIFTSLEHLRHHGLSVVWWAYQHRAYFDQENDQMYMDTIGHQFVYEYMKDPYMHARLRHGDPIELEDVDVDRMRGDLEAYTRMWRRSEDEGLHEVAIKLLDWAIAANTALLPAPAPAFAPAPALAPIAELPVLLPVPEWRRDPAIAWSGQDWMFDWSRELAAPVSAPVQAAWAEQPVLEPIPEWRRDPAIAWSQQDWRFDWSQCPTRTFAPELRDQESIDRSRRSHEILVAWLCGQPVRREVAPPNATSIERAVLLRGNASAPVLLPALTIFPERLPVGIAGSDYGTYEEGYGGEYSEDGYRQEIEYNGDDELYNDERDEQGNEGGDFGSEEGHQGFDEYDGEWDHLRDILLRR